MPRDWSTFTRRITVNYPMRSIYEAWAIPSQIERWFLRSAEYVGFDGKPKNCDLEVATGDGYLWRWHGYLDDVNESGLVTEANGLDKFAFTFTKDCLVTVSILEEGSDTVVELTQSAIPDDPDRSAYIGVVRVGLSIFQILNRSLRAASTFAIEISKSKMSLIRRGS